MQQVIGDDTSCAAGFSFCPARDSEEWSCIATDAALEHCGGCPGGPVRLGYGKDCTSIIGVDQVACVSGACQGTPFIVGNLQTADRCSLHMLRGIRAYRRRSTMPPIILDDIDYQNQTGVSDAYFPRVL